MTEQIDKQLLENFYSTVHKMEQQVDVYHNLIITPENIFQPAKMTNRALFMDFMKNVVLDGSKIEGLENLKTFYSRFQEGASSLILSEHKSNFDVPVLCSVFYRYPQEISEIFEKIVFVAGRKLNEAEIFVKTIAELFHRVIVVPKTETQNADEKEIEKAIQINLAAQRFIKENKKNYIFLVFPTGTRSRPWDRSTYNGLREVFNYLKNFDQVIFLSINGNTMKPMKDTAMSKEIVRKDKITLIFSSPFSTKEWIEEQKKKWEQTDPNYDFKQFVIDRAMDQIYSQKGIMPWDEV